MKELCRLTTLLSAMRLAVPSAFAAGDSEPKEADWVARHILDPRSSAYGIHGRRRSSGAVDRRRDTQLNRA